MTSFVDDNGNYLDYSGNDFGITKQAASWHDFKLKGDISLDFKLPNTAPNRAALGYYGAQQINSPAFGRQPFTLIRNGNRIMRGNIVIKGSDDISIDCFFISGNANWFNALQFSLKEIDFLDTFNVLANSVNTRKTATEGIIYPLVDWWAAGQHRSTVFLETTNQTQGEGPVFSEWHPCVYAHTVLSQLCQHGGVKIAGDLINDPLFRKVIITPTGPELFWPDWAINQSRIKINHDVGIIYVQASDPQVMQWTDVKEIPELNTFTQSTYSWTAPRTAAYQIDFSLYFLPAAGATYQIDMYIDGVYDSNVFTGANNALVVGYRSLTKGQRIQFYISRTVGVGNYRVTSASSVTFKIVKPIGTLLRSTYFTAPGNVPYVPPMAIVPDVKATDFIKFLCIYFGAVCSYDEYSKTLTINKYSRMNKEDGEDWSEYFISSKINYQTGVATHNYIQMNDGAEEQIGAYNDQSPVSYGGGDIQTEFDTVFERDMYRSPFSISWDQVNESNNALFMPYVKFYDLTFEEETTYSAVAAYADVLGVNLAQFTATFQQDITDTSVFFVKSNSGEYSGFHTCRDSATATTNPILGTIYGANDAGTIVKYSVGKVQSNSRLLLAHPGTSLADAGGGTIYYVYADATTGNTTSHCVAWSDKPSLNQTIDINKDSLSIDPVNNRTFNITIGERYHREIENIMGNPKIEAYFLLPSAVYSGFNFQNFVYLKTKNLTGYFWVQKIENYKDAETPVKVELLYVD